MGLIVVLQLVFDYIFWTSRTIKITLFFRWIFGEVANRDGQREQAIDGTPGMPLSFLEEPEACIQNG